MNHYQVYPIGTFHVTENGTYLKIKPAYKSALQALDGFSHLNIIWWFSELDDKEARSILEAPKPYKNAPEVMGIFATRSPIRPNPLALSTVQVLHIDYEEGLIQITYTDAHNGSPLLDIKPYTPSMDRIESPAVPDWCSHWPDSFETSGGFDWEQEFMFD